MVALSSCSTPSSQDRKKAGEVDKECGEGKEQLDRDVGPASCTSGEGDGKQQPACCVSEPTCCALDVGTTEDLGQMKEDDSEDSGDETDEEDEDIVDGDEADANCHPTEDLSMALLASLPPSPDHQSHNRSDSSSTRAPSQSPPSGMQSPGALVSRTGSPSGSHASIPEPLSLDLLASSSVPDSPAASSSRTPVLPPLVASPTGQEMRSSTGFASRRALGGSVSLSMTVTARFADAEMSIDLGTSDARIVTSLPSSLPFEMPATAEIRGHGSILGSLNVRGMPPIHFGIQTGSIRPNGLRNNFVSNEQRQRTVVCHADNLEQGNGTSVKGEGTVVEISVNDSYMAEMKVIVRRAKKKELTRLAQQQQLLRAMERKKYSSLMAQITKAKNRKVEMSLIEQAEKVLKSIVMAEGTFLNHKELSKLMKWKRVTDDSGSPTIEDCPGDDCSCNAGKAQDGEVLDILDGLVQEILKGVAPAGADGDKWLFKALVRAAGFTPEGCVWKSGGKFIMSNEERNQSANAIINLLERDDPNSDASRGIRALVNYTEKEYNCKVTAVQLNFHPNEKSSHKQHRDIYGAGQKGGINCTCSFMKCLGTMCYSLGSSRQVLTETISDSRSLYEACSEECAGRKVYSWLNSGSGMFFNDKWNHSHTHGIPAMGEPCGPRISVALLLA